MGFVFYLIYFYDLETWQRVYPPPRPPSSYSVSKEFIGHLNFVGLKKKKSKLNRDLAFFLLIVSLYNTAFLSA